MQLIMSGNSAAISLLLIVIFATIFLSVIFFLAKFLSFLSLLSSVRSSATLPYNLTILEDTLQSMLAERSIPAQKNEHHLR